jgi:hypothetical protein
LSPAHLVLGLVGVLSAPLAPPAGASVWCSPSGDLCASATGDRSGASFRLESLAPLPEARVCLRRPAREERCLALQFAEVQRGTVLLHTARLRIAGPSPGLPAAVYTARFRVGRALLGPAHRLRIGGRSAPPAAGSTTLRIAAPAATTIGRPTTVVLTGPEVGTPLRVLLSPLPGGGNCCGIAPDVARRDRLGSVELRFTWPRTYLRCAGAVGPCARVSWGRRARITVVGEPGRGLTVHDVTIRPAAGPPVEVSVLGRRDAGGPLGARAS